MSTNKPFEMLKSIKLYTGHRFPETEEELVRWVLPSFITDGVFINESTGTDVKEGYCDLEFLSTNGPRLYLTLYAIPTKDKQYDFYISDGMVGIGEDCNDLSRHPALASYALDQCFTNTEYSNWYTISEDDTIQKPDKLDSSEYFVASFRDETAGWVLKYEKPLKE